MLFKAFSKNLKLDILSNFKAGSNLHKVLRQNIDLGVAMSFLTPREIAAVRQFRDIDKRYVSSKSQDLDASANETVYFAVDKCRKQNDMFSKRDFTSLTSAQLKILFLARDIVVDVMEKACSHQDSCFKKLVVGDPSYPVIFPVSGFTTGPGVTAEGRGRLVVEKYPTGSALVVGNDIERAYLSVLQKRHLLGGVSTDSIVDGSPLKASYVPKNNRTSRMIVPQRNGSLFLQYPMGNHIEKALRYLNIDITKQPAINRQLARDGSFYDNLDVDLFGLNRSGRPCTIDLRASSGLIGLGITEFLFPHWAYEYMAMCRSSHVMLSDGNVIELPNLADMGNGFCFPVQTLVYSALLIATYKYYRQPLKRHGQRTWSVFGDDVIIDRALYEPFVKLVESLHMVVNTDKSFSTGFFRESCGCDFVEGIDVRPVMPTGVESDVDRYIAINLLGEWCALHAIKLPRTMSWLAKGIESKTCVVSWVDPLDSGIRLDFNRIDVVRSLLSRELGGRLVYTVDRVAGRTKTEYTRIEYTLLRPKLTKARFHESDVRMFHLLRTCATEVDSRARNQPSLKAAEMTALNEGVTMAILPGKREKYFTFDSAERVKWNIESTSTPVGVGYNKVTTDSWHRLVPTETDASLVTCYQRLNGL